MKLRNLLAGCASALALANPAWSNYSQIVVFGDSLSDTHRIYKLTEAIFGTGLPLAPPSYKGRVCNGPVAVEVLARELDAPLKNYSFAGARSDYNTLLLVPIGVLTQVNEYLNDNAIVPSITTIPVVSSLTSLLPGTGRADPQALHVIWTGPDDFYSLGGFSDSTAPRVARNVVQAIISLYNGGARYFFVPNMPDLSITPRATVREMDTPGYKADAAKYSAQFATVLDRTLRQWAWRFPKAKIMKHDTYRFINREVALAAARGVNVSDACYPSRLDPVEFFKELSNLDKPRVTCSTPDNYLFWDDNHPSAAANEILGVEWSKAITIRP